MKVLFATSEAAPFVKTGGLGDVAGSLPAALNEKGVDARVILPLYNCIPQEYKDKMKYIDHIYIDMAWRKQYVGVFELEYNGCKFYFIDSFTLTAISLMTLYTLIVKSLYSFQRLYCQFCRQ